MRASTRASWALLALSMCMSKVGMAVEQYGLHGSGTSNPSKLIWRAFDLLEERAKEPIKMTYRSVGSGVGQREYVGENNAMVAYSHFGSGDIPLSQERYEAITSSDRIPLHLPFVVGAISIFHSITELNDEEFSLQLKPCTVAKIFSRKITTWDDPEIVEENPDTADLIPRGQAITVVGRIFGSSSTASLTGYLHEACPDEWPADKVGSTVDWDSEVVTRQDSDGTSRYLQNNPYSIAYVEAFHGINLRLKEIKLQNKAGNYIHSSDADVGAAADAALNAGIIPESPEASWADVEIFNQDGENTWPIAAISYFYVDRNLRSLEESGRLLEAFLKFIVSEEGGEIAATFGFAGLPSSVKAIYNQALESLEFAEGTTPWTFETSDETQPGDGQQNFTFSGKRQTYAEYDRGVISTSVSLLEAQFEELSGKYEELAKSTSSGSSTSNTAIAALVISIIATLMSGVLLYMVMKPSHRWQKSSVPATLDGNF